MHKKTWSIVVAVLMVGTALLTGCAPPAAEVVEKEVEVEVTRQVEVEITRVVEKEGETVVEIVTATPEPAPVAPEGPVYGGTLNVGLYQDITALLPAGGGGGWPLFVMLDGIYDPLLEYDNKMQLQPGLAKEWEFQDDSTTVILYLRDDVTFHDGTPFNADAVKVNLERYINPTSNVVYDFTDVLKSVEVVDEYTVKLTLYEANVTFLYNLCQDAGQVMSPTALEEKGEDWLGQNPVGTGPYMLDSFDPGTEIVYVRNPNYWRKDADGNALPYLDKIVWKILVDNTVRSIALTTGEIDLMTFVPPKDYGALQKDESVKLWVQQGGVAFASLLNSEYPFNIKENRLAMRYAVDYEGLKESVFYGLSEVPNCAFFPSAMWPFDPSRPKLEQDLDRARELLAEAGNPDGFSFDMAYEPDPLGRQMAELIQANLAEIGVEVNLVQTEFARWIEILQVDHTAVQWSMPMFGRMRPNAEEYFTADWMCGGFQNFNEWCNEDFDGLINQSMRTFDRDQRLELLHQADDIFCEDVPGFPVAFWPFIHATDERVQGFELHPAGELRYRWLWLMPE